MFGMNHWLNLGASLDVQYDHGSNIVLDDEALTETYWNGTDANIHIPAWYKQVSAGLSARAEFVMPYFTINLGIGHHVVNADRHLDGWYEVLALKLNLSRRTFVHIGYSLNDFKNPNNLMLGMGLRFNNKRKSL